MTGRKTKRIRKSAAFLSKIAARVFFDYDRIEMFDEEHSVEEARFNTIGNVAAGSTIGRLNHDKGVQATSCSWYITERVVISQDGKKRGSNKENFSRIGTHL